MVIKNSKTLKAGGSIGPAPGRRDALAVRTRSATSRELRWPNEEGAEDVIDLGAPRRVRAAPRSPLRARAAHPPAAYTPNPRLYPGTSSKPKPKRKSERGEGVARRRKRSFRRPVPNARLYRPGARLVPPPPARPPAAWPPPAPAPAPPRALDTASRAALRLSETRSGPAPAPPPPPPRRLVVTVPTAAGGDASPPGMAAAPRHSASPEDRSEGNDPSSAPSEFLAEFLSAIMRRQYAEALKYCRLILQYEPHNATARGFYPLLRHKLLQHQRRVDEDEASDAEAAAGGSTRAGVSMPAAGGRRAHVRGGARAGSSASGSTSSDGEGSEGAEGDAPPDSSGSFASQSSLEMDSSERSEAAARSSPSVSVGPDRRSDSASAASAASGAWWSSAGSASTDDNGNGVAPASDLSPAAVRAAAGDTDENDNAPGGGDTRPATAATLKGPGGAALQRLRAHFACSK